MSEIEHFSAAQLIVLATELCSKSEFQGFQDLQHLRPDVLGAELCCRILLTFAPANEPPDQYVPLLKQLRGVDVGDVLGQAIDSSGVEKLAEADARRRIRQMRLKQLRPLDAHDPGADDVITRFVIQQAHRVDAETGDLPFILRLAETFIDESEYLRRWLISNLLPLVRLEYEYYSEAGPALSLAEFHDLKGYDGLDVLLQKTRTEEGRQYIVRDLRGIIGPWMYGARSSKRRKLNPSFRRASIVAQDTHPTLEDSGWQDVNEWILTTSLNDQDLTARAISEWDGPNDVDLGGYEDPLQPLPEDPTLSIRYGQAILATLYATEDTSVDRLRNSMQIVERVAKITGVDVDLPRPSNFNNLLSECSAQPESIAAISRSALMFENLLEPNNALTLPSPGSLEFIGAILTSIQILKDDLFYKQHLSCRNVLNLCLFVTEEQQRQELHKTLQNFAGISSVETDWRTTREKVVWLSRWRSTMSTRPLSEHESCRALYWRVSREDIETEFFNALLTAKQYQTAVAMYMADAETSPLPLFLIEKLVEHQILDAYDNASNGNRSRGGLRRASEILKAFGPHFPQSSPVNKTEHLLAATHSMSFYQLTLHHGVPFQPVSIRVHQDPISLIGKVLEQNSKAYTKLDDLLSIGRGMVAAGLPISSEDDEEPNVSTDDSMENKLLEADHRITYDAIISALSSNDFDTAYSYILTRLSPSPQSSSTSATVDDTSWRAAYAAGRHRLPPSTSPSEKISNLSKRMELLSLALTLVPDPTPLPSMLSTWQSCENELNLLRAREAAEEKAWDDRGDNISSVPGGFGMEDRETDIAETKRERDKRTNKVANGGRFDHDEAPMGLFDVARGAARAIGKSAFPLRGAGGTRGVNIGTTEAPSPTRSSEEYTRSGDEGQQYRVRKRDMVSNMVTGGLVSGLGWVLGAQPVGQGERNVEQAGRMVNE